MLHIKVLPKSRKHACFDLATWPNPRRPKFRRENKVDSSFLVMPNDKHESTPAQMETEDANKALRPAIKRGQVETVIDLLKRGTSPIERDKNGGSSPLHVACSRN